MIIAITVVMLMTLIPLAIFTQAVQQLPLARHDQDHESALAAAEAGVDDYLNRLAQNQNYWTYNAANPPPDGNQAFTSWVTVPGSEHQRRVLPLQRRTRRRPRRPASCTSRRRASARKPTLGCTSAGVIRTVKVGLRRQGFLDYLWLTDYEITDPALSGANATTCKFHAWEWNTGPARKYGPNNVVELQVVYWTSQAVLNGPVHSNDGLYVCGNPTFNGDTDTYYNSPTSNNAFHSTQFGGPGHGAEPAGVRERARRTAQRRSRERVAPAVPAREHVDQQPGRRRARRHRLPVHRPDDDHAERRDRQDGRDEPEDAVDERGLRAGQRTSTCRRTA